MTMDIVIYTVLKVKNIPVDVYMELSRLHFRPMAQIFLCCRCNHRLSMWGGNLIKCSCRFQLGNVNVYGWEYVALPWQEI
jgi:hypothetical protein